MSIEELGTTEVAPEEEAAGRVVPTTEEGRNVNGERTSTAGVVREEARRTSNRSSFGTRRSSRTFSDAEIPDWGMRPATQEERTAGKKSRATALPVTAHLSIREWQVYAEGGHEMVKLKFSIQFRWVDYRLANWVLDEDIPDNIWRPELFILADALNKQMKFTDQGDTNLASSSKPTLASRDRNDGALLWIVDTEETTFEVMSSADGLRSFPFDSVRYDFVLGLSGEKRLEGSCDVRFDWEKTCEMILKVPVLPPSKCSSGDFDMKGISYAKGRHYTPTNPTDGYEDVLLSLHVKRNPKFYLFKTCFPLYAILIFGSLSYCLEVTDLSGRLNLIFAMFLTCFALQWIVLDRLPRVPYMTVLDTIITIVNASLLLMGVGFAVTAVILSREQFSLFSDEIDGSNYSLDEIVNQVRVPEYSLSQIRQADRCDRVMQIVVVSCLIPFHIYVWFGVRSNRKTEGMYRPWSAGSLSFVPEQHGPHYVAFPITHARALLEKRSNQSKELKSGLTLAEEQKQVAEIERGFLGVEKEVF
ncbi:unnamed protein product [Amoebophrya sp. A120]|nr:unnamed protein product [Amoebophrya sp. A120]|eukprot:GSA120T00022853001.1